MGRPELGVRRDSDAKPFVAADGPPAPCRCRHRHGPPQNNTLGVTSDLVAKNNMTKCFQPDFGVTVCNHVFCGAPVLLVVRDEELSWQFLCGGSLEDDKPHHVGVGNLLARDATLAATVELEIGAYAERQSQKTPWIIGRLDE